MIKRITVIFFVVTFFAAIGFAQNRNVSVDKVQIVGDTFHPVIGNTSNTPYIPVDGGVEMIFTGYDYETNNATRRMLQMVDLDFDGVADPFMVGMKRDVEGSTRHVVMGYQAFGVVDTFNCFDGSLTPVGWGEVQLCEGGPNDGQALVMGHLSGTAWHSWIDLANFEPIQPFPQTTFGNSPTFAWPGFVYLGSQAGTILGNTTELVTYASTDGGATFDSLFRIGDGDPNVDMDAPGADFPAEWGLFKSADDMVIATVGAPIAVGMDGSGVPDIVYWYGSTDAGATWNGLIFGYGSGDFPLYGQVVNRDYAPYFTNFQQVGYIIDPTQVTHVMCNGYGEGLYMGGTDTVFTFPMLYWNSNHQNWIAVTDELMEPNEDASGNMITGPGANENLYPGNGIGNGYGTIATNNTGEIVFVMWQGPEYVDGIGGTWNIYPGDGGAASTAVYYTDLYYSASEDGGATWGPVGVIEGAQLVQESYPVLFQDLTIDGNQATAHYVYYIDPIPGTSIFATPENSFDPNGIWKYNSYTWTLSVSVDDDIVVNSFNLEQNYPNPFNPSTTIKYSLAERSDVSLKVYDVLGKEVANVVNTTQGAGEYEVEFDASVLSSGLYIYTITAGEFVSSKKMMLLK
jgi:hypothetical protein